VKNLGGLKGEILRGAQNDKNSLLIAQWYENCLDYRRQPPGRSAITLGLRAWAMVW